MTKSPSAAATTAPSLEALNATDVDYPDHLPLHGLFEEHAASQPDRRAVSTAEGRLSYGELERRSNRLANELAHRGVGPGSIVGILMNRSLELPVALLAVLKAGGAYLPLDPDYPSERLSFMATDSDASLILTEPALDDRRPAVDTPFLDVERSAASIREHPDSAPQLKIDSEGLAYLIYTSGSTGRPKGVEIQHRSVVNFLCSMAGEPGLAASDILIALTTISFDISVLELFLPLTVGAEIHLVDRDTASDGHLLARAMVEAGTTVMQATPATWRMLLDAGWEGQPTLKALCGGEALPPQLADRLLKRCGSLWNVYGPTETTIWSTLAELRSSEPPISIGRPIANTQVYVVDEGLLPVADGTSGELVIGGDGLARGYRGRPNLTAEQFVESRSVATGSGRLYRTGDLARLLPDGTLECLGRIDHQVKIRGFRIEPGEIERVLEEHPSVQTAVVVARTDSSGLKRLVAYVTGPSAERDDGLTTELRERVRAALPPQMTPSVFVPLDELPLTGSGKIDRNALPDPSSALDFSPTGSAPSTRTELAIAGAFEEVLEIAPIGVDDDFFALGGHSLLLHQVRTLLSESLELELAMVELTRHPTVAALADHLDRRGDRACDDTGVYGRGNPHPLATMARRFLIPRPFLTLYFMWKFRAKVSPRAEVELSRNLDLGRGTTIGSFTKLKADKGPLVIGERSSFANGCFVGSGPGGLRIGVNLVCGPNVTIVPSNYVIDRKNVHLADQGHTSQGIRIGDNVWIGAGSVVLDGAEIGDNTVVTAGSVVDRKFEGDCVLRGNPAEIVARR